MKYKIILDEDKLNGFINWLPNLKPNEKFYVCLFARKKYDESLKQTKTDKAQLKRFLATKENLVDKIKKLEIDYGLYKIKDTIATQQSLALYITPNPRCMKKAQSDLVIRLVKNITDGSVFNNVASEALSSVQRSKSYNFVVDFDIDSKSIELGELNNILPQNSFNVLETKGGYHILVNPAKVKYTSIDNKPSEFFNNWYKKIQQTFNVDQSGDQMIPVPGCTQGGFCPEFITI